MELCWEWDFCLLCLKRPWDGERRRDQAGEMKGALVRRQSGAWAGKEGSRRDAANERSPTAPIL